ncbi:hypothetical protein DSO57_1033835 [Entomophthora muscae]|uniref:Uncharacterized protein n=1 Tax=Entomophthora muscae TaxID=34485 RepID=A0ACC2RF63_9FUNG|nr:hypothetical protein DSO57_1033835 [Entomophthora muscae]
MQGFFATWSRYLLEDAKGIGDQDSGGRWGPASGTSLLVLQNVNFMPANFVAPPPILENENCVTSQCPEFYAEDALMLSQVLYLGLLWLGLIVLLNPGVSIGNFTKRYLKPLWWLIINSMWIWVVIPHHLETASYYPVISVTVMFPKFGFDLFSNELPHIVAFVFFGGLRHRPPGCIVDSCYDVLLALAFTRHWSHNVQQPYLEGLCDGHEYH